MRLRKIKKILFFQPQSNTVLLYCSTTSGIVVTNILNTIYKIQKNILACELSLFCYPSYLGGQNCGMAGEVRASPPGRSNSVEALRHPCDRKVNQGGKAPMTRVGLVAYCNHRSQSSSPRQLHFQPDPVLITIMILNLIKPIKNL